MKKVAIIIPTFNERENIALTLSKIYNALPQANVVVVDDSSPDETAKVVQEQKKKYPRISLLVRKKIKGRGSAVIVGFAYALKNLDPEVFVEMDADLSHDPRELLGLIDALRRNTIVIASRYLSKSRIIGWTLKRRIMSRISNRLIRLILVMPIHDNTNGFRAYSIDAIKLLVRKKFISEGYIVLSESAYYLMKKGFVFKELPTTFRNRTKGKSNTNLTQFIDALMTIIKIKLISFRELSK